MRMCTCIAHSYLYLQKLDSSNLDQSLYPRYNEVGEDLWRVRVPLFIPTLTRPKANIRPDRKPDPAKITSLSQDAPPTLSLSRDEPPPRSRLDYTPAEFVPPEEQRRPSDRKIKKEQDQSLKKKEQEQALKEQEQALRKKEQEQSHRTSGAWYRRKNSHNSSKHPGTFYEDGDEARGNERSRRNSRDSEESPEGKRLPGRDRPPDLEPNQIQEKGSPLRTIKQLRESYESFKEYVWEKCPEAVEYVETLWFQNFQLSQKCDALMAEMTELTSSLQADWDDAIPVVTKLHPENRDDLHQMNIHQLLSFLVQRQEMACKDNQELHRELHLKKWEYELECRRLETNVGDKCKQISRWEIYHASEMDRVTAKHHEALREKDGNMARVMAEHKSALCERDEFHKSQEARWRSYYDNEINKQKALLESENQRHDEEKISLEARYNADLHQQRVKLETDMTLLQQAFLTTVDRFQPLEDSVLQFRFRNLKNAVGRIARTRLEVDSEGLARAFDQRSFIQMAEKRHHKFVLESTLWSILIQGFFSTPFRVLGDNGNSFAVTWSQLFQPRECSLFISSTDG